MEEQVLYNVLKSIQRDKTPGNSAPTTKYITSLIETGIITEDWDKTYLTSLGNSILDKLRAKFEKW